MLLFELIRIVFTLLTWLVIINAILSFFMSPYHPVKATIDRLVEPMLAPIRRLMPQTGMVDFSPLVLIILLRLIEFVLTQLIVNLF